MPSAARVYRVLVRLYPREFRDEYADDLVQAFRDLVDHRGVRVACGRAAADLAVTVPRYRLETIMSARRSSVVVALLAVAGAGAGAAVLAAGVAGWAALAVVLVAGILMVAQRRRLARGLRPDAAGDGRRWWARSAIALAGAVAVLVIGFADLGDEEHWPAGRLLAYNLVFLVAAITAIVSSVVALRRPRAT